MEVKITAADVLRFCQGLESPTPNPWADCTCPLHDGKGHYPWCTFANERDALVKVAKILHNLALEGDAPRRDSRSSKT